MNSFLQAVIDFLGQVVGMALSAIFIENFIFSRALGSSVALVSIRKKNNLLLFGAILTAITVVAGLLTYLIRPLVAAMTEHIGSYLTPLVYVLVIGVVYVLALLLCSASERLSKTVKPMIHLTAFNCAVLGALLLMNANNLSLPQMLGFGLGVGMGFSLATFLISLPYEYLHSKAIPRAFRGFPILLIYIGLLSLVFYGMVGHELPF